MQTAPVPEYRLIEIRGSPATARLPLSERVSLMMEVGLSKVPRVGRRIDRMAAAETHKQTFTPSRPDIGQELELANST